VRRVVWPGVVPGLRVRRPGPAPGTPLGDLHLLLAAAGDGAAALAALERTVDRIPWRPRRPAVRRALAARAAAAGGVDGVKRRELRAAVYLVLAERRRPQAHRFGRSWLTDGAGRVVPAVPEALAPALYWRWFGDEVRKAAEASLLGEPYPVLSPLATADAAPEAAGGAERGALARGGTAPQRGNRLVYFGGGGLDGCADPAPAPLDVLLRREQRREAAAAWRAALAGLSPAHRRSPRLRGGWGWRRAPPACSGSDSAIASGRCGRGSSPVRMPFLRPARARRPRRRLPAPL
jgi:hypothetical protein